MSEEGYQINLNEFHQAIDTWIPGEREGYRLYVNEQLRTGVTHEYVVTQYSWQDRNGEVIAMGHAEFDIPTPDKEKVNDAMEDEGLTQFTDKQWKTVVAAYEDMCETILGDQLFDGVPQLYKVALYYEVDNFGDAFRYYLDQYQEKIDKCKEYEEKNEGENYYSDYAQYGRLGDDQYHNIGLVENGIEWEHSDTVPYAKHCQVAAILDIEPYEDWELRAIEHLHNGVFVNKPALAKTKALLEDGMTQKQIAEKFGKDASTVSRQVSQIDEWEKRASWTAER